MSDPEEGETDQQERPAVAAPPRWIALRRRWSVAAIALALVAGLISFAARDDRPPPTTTTTTTTSTTTTAAPTTTKAPEVLPVGTSAIATAKASVGRVHVRSTPPDGWDTAAATLLHAPQPLPPASQDALPPRDALPRPDYPVQGRFAVDGGWEFANPGPYEPPQPFTMSVVEQRGEWIEVRVPVRPNGTHGWVHASEVDLSRTEHRIEVHLAERMLRAWDGADVIVETPVVVGSPSTVTPTGVFYVTDKVPQPNPGGAYGPIVLATNGYSEVMDYFDTGVPVIALHGTNHPERVGQAVSNGCVRVPNELIVQLAEAVPAGTPVYIWP